MNIAITYVYVMLLHIGECSQDKVLFMAQVHVAYIRFLIIIIMMNIFFITFLIIRQTT